MTTVTELGEEINWLRAENEELKAALHIAAQDKLCGYDVLMSHQIDEWRKAAKEAERWLNPRYRPSGRTLPRRYQ